MTDGGTSVVELDAADAITLDAPVGVTKYDPPNALESTRSAWAVHPSDQSNAGRPAPMRRHRGGLVDTGGDRHVIDVAGHLRGNCACFAIDHDSLRTRRHDRCLRSRRRAAAGCRDADAVESALKPGPLRRPTGPTRWRTDQWASWLPSRNTNSVAGNRCVPLVEPFERSSTDSRFVTQPAPAKIEQVAAPDTEIRIHRSHGRSSRDAPTALQRLLNRCRSEMNVKPSDDGADWAMFGSSNIRRLHESNTTLSSATHVAPATCGSDSVPSLHFSLCIDAFAVANGVAARAVIPDLRVAFLDHLFDIVDGDVVQRREMQSVRDR